MDDTTERVRRVERGLRPSPAALVEEDLRPLTLEERMARLGVVGLGVAVIADHRVDWARGYGLRAAGRPEPVDPGTLFQAGSISKPVTAVAAVRLAQEGRLSLDEDVNAYLRSWRVPANGPWRPRVTLRQLLSHTAGTTVDGFPGYRRDRPAPSLRQVLDGEPPANTPAVRVNLLPGTRFRYSGGGTSVVQRVLENLCGQPFAELMRELVLEPVGMRASTFEQPLPPGRWGEAASGHYWGGAAVDGGWHVYPEQAAAGLWTTPSDLARLAVDLQRAGRGEAGTLLTKTAVDELLAPGPLGPFGLGFQVKAAGHMRRFEHDGADEGFLGRFVAYAEGGVGAVVMTNAYSGGAVVGEVVRAVAREYGWPGYAPTPRVALDLEPAALEAYAGEYDLRPGYRLAVGVEGATLSVAADGQPPLAFQPGGGGQFFCGEVNAVIAFDRNESGAVTGLRLQQEGEETAARLRTARREPRRP